MLETGLAELVGTPLGSFQWMRWPHFVSLHGWPAVRRQHHSPYTTLSANTVGALTESQGMVERVGGCLGVALEDGLHN